MRQTYTVYTLPHPGWEFALTDGLVLTAEKEIYLQNDLLLNLKVASA